MAAVTITADTTEVDTITIMDTDTDLVITTITDTVTIMDVVTGLSQDVTGIIEIKVSTIDTEGTGTDLLPTIEMTDTIETIIDRTIAAQITIEHQGRQHVAGQQEAEEDNIFS